jgi:hypothetical protein
MPKVIINPIQNLDNPPTAVARLNANFAAIQAAIEKTLSRDGTVPNAMQSDFDMNAHRMLNLPVPVSPTEPARHGDIQQYVDQARDWAEYSEDQADRAEQEADAAEQSAIAAENALLDLKSRYIGAFNTPPTQNTDGTPLLVGALYFNFTLNLLYVFAIDDIHSNGDPVVVGDIPVIVGYWIPVPAVEFTQLNDVDLSAVQNGDFLIWDGLQVKPVTLTADGVPQSNSLYNGATVQDALDDLTTRTSLGIYDIYIYAQGLPGNSEEIVRLIASRTFFLPVSAPGSVAKLRQAPSGDSVVFTIRKNDVAVGTVTFADGSVTGSFTVAGTVTLNPGDILSITAPSGVNVAVRDLSITLACTR